MFSRIAHNHILEALLLISLLLALLALGLWQLQRAEEKKQLQKQLSVRGNETPMDIRALYSDMRPEEDLNGKQVLLPGHYDNEHIWFLDNRMYERRVGFEAITPFRTEGGMYVLVNRGWRPGDPARRKAPQLGETPEEFLKLQGTVYQPRKKMLVLKEQAPESGWPRQIQRVDIQKMRNAVEGDVFPYLVRLKPRQPGVRPADWLTATGFRPERHTAYAFTWFSLAVLLAALQALRMWRTGVRT